VSYRLSAAIGLIAAAYLLASCGRASSAAPTADVRRQLNLLKVSLVLATPSNPKEAEELTTLVSSMRGVYGKGKWCPDAAKPDHARAIQHRVVGPAVEVPGRGAAVAARRGDVRSMLSMGLSKPWPDALQAMTGSRDMDASAILDYFAPLQAWLQEQNKGQPIGW